MNKQQAGVLTWAIAGNITRFDRFTVAAQCRFLTELSRSRYCSRVPRYLIPLTVAEDTVRR